MILVAATEDSSHELHTKLFYSGIVVGKLATPPQQKNPKPILSSTYCSAEVRFHFQAHLVAGTRWTVTSIAWHPRRLYSRTS